MNRLQNCLQFKLKSSIKSTLWFLGIYYIIYLAMFLMLRAMVKSSPRSSGNMQSGFFIAGAIFLFIYIAANYKPNFNFLLMFGNTRKNIFLTAVVVNTVISILMSVVSIISQSLDVTLTNELSGNGISHNKGLLDMIYQNNVNIASEFLWYLMLFVTIYSLAMLYGSLSYKFGRIFITVFWIGFGLSWTVLPIMSGLNNGTILANALKAFFSTGNSNGILLAPINFAIASIVFCTATYLLSTRQSQVA